MGPEKKKNCTGNCRDGALREMRRPQEKVRGRDTEEGLTRRNGHRVPPSSSRVLPGTFPAFKFYLNDGSPSREPVENFRNKVFIH